VARKAELWTPPTDIIGVDASQNVVPPMMEVFASGTGAPGAAVAGGGDQHKPKVRDKGRGVPVQPPNPAQNR